MLIHGHHQGPHPDDNITPFLKGQGPGLKRCGWGGVEMGSRSPPLPAPPALPGPSCRSLLLLCGDPWRGSAKKSSLCRRFRFPDVGEGKALGRGGTIWGIMFYNDSKEKVWPIFVSGAHVLWETIFGQTLSKNAPFTKSNFVFSATHLVFPE